MGLFLDGELGYDANENLFLMKLINRYWYVRGWIPIRFKTSDGGSNNGTQLTYLEIPLYTPYHSATLISFNKTFNEQGSGASNRKVTLQMLSSVILLHVFLEKFIS